MKVTQQEIVSLIEGLIESDACMGSISDKQVIMSLEVVSRIKQHGIAPPDGWVLVPKEPTAEMLKAFHWKNVGEGYADMLAAAPEVKP